MIWRPWVRTLVGSNLRCVVLLSKKYLRVVKHTSLEAVCYENHVDISRLTVKVDHLGCHYISNPSTLSSDLSFSPSMWVPMQPAAFDLTLYSVHY